MCTYGVIPLLPFGTVRNGTSEISFRLLISPVSILSSTENNDWRPVRKFADSGTPLTIVQWSFQPIPSDEWYVT